MGIRRDPRRTGRFLFCSSQALVCLLLLASPGRSQAQVVTGRLLDAETGDPVVNGTVALRDSVGAIVARAASDPEGRFRITAPRPGRYSLHAAGMGYRSAPSSQFTVGEEGEVGIDLALSPEPIQLPGFDVGGGTLQERLERVKVGLDMRLEELPGESAVVPADRVRLYDAEHAKDPYKLLWRELRLGWSFDMEGLRHHYFGIGERPEVYVDDRRTWLINLVLMPNSELCRVEMYRPPPFLPGPQVPFQLRGYTCQFMAEVATGIRTLREHVNWGDLIAGPDAFPPDNSGWGGRGGSR